MHFALSYVLAYLAAAGTTGLTYRLGVSRHGAAGRRDRKGEKVEKDPRLPA